MYAVKKYGADYQIDRCIEEMSELTKELLKDRRKRRDISVTKKILSELGDVIFTLHHIQTAYCFDDEEISDALDKSLYRFKSEENLP